MGFNNTTRYLIELIDTFFQFKTCHVITVFFLEFYLWILDTFSLRYSRTDYRNSYRQTDTPIILTPPCDFKQRCTSRQNELQQAIPQLDTFIFIYL